MNLPRFFALSCIALLLSSIEAKSDRKVIVLMVDGFANFYLRDSSLDLVGLESLSNFGVKAEHLVPIFPTLTIPNLYSLVTGLYAESHGLTGNNMWNPETDEYFELGRKPNDYKPHWWNRTEPIWITAERQGIRTALLWWYGCQVEFPNVSVTHCQPHINSSETDLREQIPEIMGKLKAEDWQLVFIYYEDVDHQGHRGGPHSGAVKESLMRVSDIVGSLQDSMKSSGLDDKTDLILLSDHGMARLSMRSIWFIDDFLEEMTTIEKIIDYGPLVMLYPYKGNEHRVYQELSRIHPMPNVSVYWSSDLPERYHWKLGPHIAPIVLVADLGVGICTRDTSRLFPALPVELTEEMFERGHHGYDPVYKEMKGIFMAKGPDFKENIESGPIHMTDVYQVLCYILDIECHRHNGTWANVYKMLRPTKKLEGLAIDSSIANRTSSEFTSSTSKLISSYSILTTVVVTLLSGLLIRPIQM